MKNTHHLKIDFGQHVGTPWTQVPVGYLRWIANEKTMNKERVELAISELNRRGSTLPEIKVTHHAIDRASLRVFSRWANRSNRAEGFYSWLHRVAADAATLRDTKKDDQRITKDGIKFVFTFGRQYPILKTVLGGHSTGATTKASKCYSRAPEMTELYLKLRAEDAPLQTLQAVARCLAIACSMPLQTVADDLRSFERY